MCASAGVLALSPTCCEQSAVDAAAAVPTHMDLRRDIDAISTAVAAAQDERRRVWEAAGLQSPLPLEFHPKEVHTVVDCRPAAACCSL